MDKNTRWVFLGFIGSGLLIAWVLSEGFKNLFHWLRPFNIRDIRIFGDIFTLSSLSGFALTLVVGTLLWRNDSILRVSHEVVEELKKVIWPDWKDTQTSTIVVVATTIIIATILWCCDFFWAWFTGVIYSGQV